jgi:hypothetical protein
MSKPNCFWQSQGRCTLSYFPEDLVYEILSTNPTARADLLDCGLECGSVNLSYIEFAENDRTLVEDSIETNERRGKRVRQYNDRTKEAQQQPPQLPVVPPKGENT